MKTRTIARFHWPSLAKISHKAKQLTEYRAPVVLAITVADRIRSDRQAVCRQVREKVDIRRISGAVTTTLPLVQEISAVLLSLWDVEPAIEQSGIRLRMSSSWNGQGNRPHTRGYEV